MWEWQGRLGKGLRGGAGHLAEETAATAGGGRGLLGRRGSVLVCGRLSDGAGLASLRGLLGSGAGLGSGRRGALGRRGGTAGLARHGW